MVAGVALLVEGNPYRRSVLMRALNAYHWAVIAVGDMSAAYNCLAQAVFDVLILSFEFLLLSNTGAFVDILMQNINSLVIWYSVDFNLLTVHSGAAENNTRLRILLSVQHALDQAGRRYQRVPFIINHRRIRKPTTLVSPFSPSILVDTSQRQVIIEGRLIKLSAGEMKLLQHLIQSPQQMSSFKELAGVLYEQDFSHTEARELLKMRIHRLRQKIEREPDSPRIICSVRGYGFMLCSTVTLVQETHDQMIPCEVLPIGGEQLLGLAIGQAVAGTSCQQPECDGYVGPKVESVDQSMRQRAGYRSSRTNRYGGRWLRRWRAHDAPCCPAQAEQQQWPAAQPQIKDYVVGMGRVDFIGIAERRIDVALVDQQKLVETNAERVIEQHR